MKSRQYSNTNRLLFSICLPFHIISLYAIWDEKCSAWNDDGNIKCLRCHAKPLSQNDRSSYDEPFDKEYHRTSRYRGSSKEDIGNDSNEHRHRRIATNDGIPSSDTNNATAADLDEFGRVRSQQPKKTRWPPCFETHGSSFVLDTRSGMFYESTSDFFYDPKSKLYYGNKQSAYFQYDPIKRSFIDLSENKSKAAERESPPAASGVELQPAIQPSEVKKTSITIKLKTKLLTSTTASKRKKDNGSLKEKPKSVVPEPVAVPKQHAINIEKWSERQNEIRQQAEDVKSKLEGDEKTKIVATAKGEPICLLCRRRFPNVDKLRHHEEVSTLHKENLAKQASLSNEKKQESSNVTSTNIPSPIVSSATYIDRAEQRRQLHQLDQTKVSCLRTLNSDVHSIVSADNTLSSNSDRLVETRNGSNSTLDESNIGHQMLQKLGWKSGNLVGKKSDDNHVRIADDNGRQAVSASTTSRIEQDWDRIEAVSKLTSSQRGSSMQIGGKKGIGL
jgi:RNA-binding protein 5/10